MKKLLSKNILKQSVRNNWKLWAILTGVLCFFITIITLVTNARITNGRGQGGLGSQLTLIGLYANMFFQNMGLILILIYAIATGNKLVASEVDKGTMSFTLNTPTTRKQIIFSKLLFYVVSLVLMALLMGLFASVTSKAINAELELKKFWLLILGFTLFGIATSGICFAASCWFNKSGFSLLLGAGLPVTFLLFNSLSAIEELEFLKYFSLNTLFDTSAIISGSGYIAQFIVMGLMGVALYALGIIKFLKKDLPL